MKPGVVVILGLSLWFGGMLFFHNILLHKVYWWRLSTLTFSIAGVLWLRNDTNWGNLRVKNQDFYVHPEKFARGIFYRGILFFVLLIIFFEGSKYIVTYSEGYKQSTILLSDNRLPIDEIGNNPDFKLYSSFRYHNNFKGKEEYEFSILAFGRKGVKTVKLTTTKENGEWNTHVSAIK